MLTHPVTLFCGPHFIVNTMQAGTTPIFNVFGMTGPSSNRESNPQILLVSAGSPLLSPFTISRGYWGPIRYQGAPSEAPTPDPHGVLFKDLQYQGVARLAVLSFRNWSLITARGATKITGPKLFAPPHLLRTDSSRGGPFLFFCDYFQSF